MFVFYVTDSSSSPSGPSHQGTIHSSTFLTPVRGLSTNLIIGCIIGVVATIITFIAACTFFIVYRKKSSTDHSSKRNLSGSPGSSKNSSRLGSRQNLGDEGPVEVIPNDVQMDESFGGCLDGGSGGLENIPMGNPVCSVPLSSSSFPLLVQSDNSLQNYGGGGLMMGEEMDFV